MGCFAQARDKRFPDGMRQAAARSYAYMRSSNLADTRDWVGTPATSVVDGSRAPMFAQLAQAWGSGVAAMHRGDRPTAEKHYAFLRDKGGSVDTAWESPYVPVWKGTLHALLLSDAGDHDGALLTAKNAADYEASLPVDFGPPVAFKPARELEGEILLDLGRGEDAMTAFHMALARTPNRILSLAGYARAAVAAGRMEIAANAYGRLAELLHGADAGMAEAREARAY